MTARSVRRTDHLGRVDDLLRAVKKARQRANSTEIVKAEIGMKLTGFLLTGETS